MSQKISRVRFTSPVPDPANLGTGIDKVSYDTHHGVYSLELNDAGEVVIAALATGKFVVTNVPRSYVPVTETAPVRKVVGR